MKIKKWHIAAVLLALGVGAYLLFFRKTGIPVKEIKIKQKVVKKTVSAAGTVKSKNQANLSFSTVGILSHLAVEEGDEVKTGDYLAALNNYSESQSTQALKDARDAAERDLELYIEDYESNKDAVGGADEYAIEKRKYEELLSKAEATYQAQVGALEKTYIYAPFEGKIIDIFSEIGETLLAGSEVLKVADEDLIIFEIELDQEDFGFLRTGMKVQVELDAYAEDTFQGEIKNLPTYVETDDGGDFVIEIELLGENKDKALLGMTGDAYIILNTTEKEVPALTFDEVKYDIEDKPFVYVFDNGRVSKQYIDLGLQGDIYTEVKSSIEKPIIQESDAKFDLEEGVKVKLVR